MSGSPRYSRSGRPRPVGSRRELAAWYAVRYSALALFVLALAHFSMTHFVYDPANQTAEWIIQMRWSSLLLRALDWSMLMIVLLHSFLGMRTVLQDYTPSRVRSVVLAALYLLAGLLAVLGTVVVVTLRVNASS